jgi:hypothetical protein
MWERWDSEPFQRVELGEQTTPWDQVVAFRVRSRLAERGLTLQIQALKDGWSWSIRERPPDTVPAFGSLHQALYHADACTALWYPD